MGDMIDDYRVKPILDKEAVECVAAVMRMLIEEHEFDAKMFARAAVIALSGMGARAMRTAQATLTIPAGAAGPNEQIVTRWHIGQTEDAVVVRPDGYRVELIDDALDALRDAVIEECAAKLTDHANASYRVAQEDRAKGLDALARDSARAAEVFLAAARSLSEMAASRPRKSAE